ncbi:MAG: response regulator [Desulfuromonadaceae bacterium]|nr:response regulator [Desulfuromonadaceae bacterium]
MNSLNILFVDDDAVLLSSLKRLLGRIDLNAKICFANSASDALIIMEEAPIDLIVADMCMARMNGHQLLLLVKERYPSTIRVMMTGSPDYDIYRNSMDVCQYFLFKPVQISALQILLEMVTNKEMPIKSDTDIPSETVREKIEGFSGEKLLPPSAGTSNTTTIH